MRLALMATVWGHARGGVRHAQPAAVHIPPAVATRPWRDDLRRASHESQTLSTWPILDESRTDVYDENRHTWLAASADQNNQSTDMHIPVTVMTLPFGFEPCRRSTTEWG